MSEPVYSYKSQDGRYYNCTLEIVNGLLSTTTDKCDKKITAHPKVTRKQFFADAGMTMDDIVQRVRAGLMNENAIPLAMGLLL